MSNFLTKLFTKNDYECSVCETTVDDWKMYGTPVRPGLCPHCGAKPRHREMVAFIQHLQKSGQLTNGSKILEVGPSKVTCLKVMTPKFLQGISYTVVDIRELPHHQVIKKNGYEYRQSSATELPFQDESFDLVICNQVLPYIEEDVKAMAEMRRVLKSSGIAVLNSHVESYPQSKKIADLQKSQPEKYTAAFIEENGTAWEYGQDYLERLQQAGWKVGVEEILPYVGLSASDRDRLGLKASSEWYLCRK